MSDWTERRASDARQHVHVETRIKVNAWLHVLPRQDGQTLHELESLFLSVAAGDRLTVEAVPSSSAEFRLTSNRPDLVPGNSVHQAWTRFTSAIQPLAGHRDFRISAHLEKRIPEKSGLGAASGDAGAALLLLNELHGFPLGHDQLLALASSLGSDVPFFLRSGPCIVRGMGEIVDPIPTLPRRWCCIALPTFRVDTRRAYMTLDDAINRGGASGIEPTVDLNAVVEALRTGTPLRGSDDARLNSFDATLGENTASYLGIRSMLLAGGAILAGLSGSGSAIFGIYAERAAAEAAALEVRRRISAVQTLVAEIL